MGNWCTWTGEVFNPEVGDMLYLGLGAVRDGVKSSLRIGLSTVVGSPGFLLETRTCNRCPPHEFAEAQPHIISALLFLAGSLLLGCPFPSSLFALNLGDSPLVICRYLLHFAKLRCKIVVVSPESLTYPAQMFTAGRCHVKLCYGVKVKPCTLLR